MDVKQDPRVIFSILDLSNLELGEDTELVSQTHVICHRKQPPEVRPNILVHEPPYPPPRELPKRLPSLLPHPSLATLALSVNVGEALWTDDHASVYTVEVSDHDRPPHKAWNLPDLVVKVALGTAGHSYISREAFFYQEMERLQGVCIARYYGFFRATLSDTLLISCLLLERLGPPLPGPQFIARILEVKDMCRELEPLGIYYPDLVRRNIVTAPSGQHALSGMPSALSGKVFTLRLQNFGNTEKTNQREDDLHNAYFSWLEHLERMGDESDSEDDDGDDEDAADIPDYLRA